MDYWKYINWCLFIAAVASVVLLISVWMRVGKGKQDATPFEIKCGLVVLGGFYLSTFIALVYVVEELKKWVF